MKKILNWIFEVFYSDYIVRSKSETIDLIQGGNLESIMVLIKDSPDQEVALRNYDYLKKYLTEQLLDSVNYRPEQSSLTVAYPKYLPWFIGMHFYDRVVIAMKDEWRFLFVKRSTTDEEVKTHVKTLRLTKSLTVTRRDEVIHREQWRAL